MFASSHDPAFQSVSAAREVRMTRPRRARPCSPASPLALAVQRFDLVDTVDRSEVLRRLDALLSS